MTTAKLRPKCVFALLIIATWELSGTCVGADRDADALPPGAVARFGWLPLRIGYGAAFALSPDHRTLVALTPQGSLRRFDAQTGRLLERRQLTDRSDVELQRDCTAQLSADAQIAAIYESGLAGPRMTVYEVASGKKIFRRESGESLLLFGKLSPNGKQLAVAESPRTGTGRNLRLIDLPTGRLREMGAYGQYDLGIYFSADGKRLLVSEPIEPPRGSIQTDSKIAYFDLTTGKKIWQRSATGTNFALSRDGKTVLAAGYGDLSHKESGIHLLRMDGASSEPTVSFMSCFRGAGGLGGPLPFETFRLAPDDRTIVAQYFEEIYIWDLQSRKEIRRFQFSKDTIDRTSPLPMVISTDSRTLFTNGQYLQRWDLTTGKPIFTPPDESSPNYLIQLAFAPDGKELFASSDKGLSKWNLATGKRIDLTPDKRQFDHSLYRTPQGLRSILYGSPHERDGKCKVRVLDPVSHKTLHTIRVTAANGLCDPSIDRASLTANGKVLLVCYREKKYLPSAAVFTQLPQAAAWEVATGRKLSDFTVSHHADNVRTVFSPCGRWVMLADKLHHVGSGSKLFEPSGLPGEQMNFGDFNVWFSVDGRLLATTIGTYEEKWPRAHTLAVWELASGKILARFPKPGFVTQAAFLPDGRTFVLLDAQGLRLEDLLSGKQIAIYPTSNVSCDWHPGLAFSPDGATMATSHKDATIVLWKVPRSRPADPSAPADGELEKLWADLASSSPLKARTAIDRLARHPDAASALLAKRFCAPPVDAKIVALTTDFDSDKIATRQQASRKLLAYGAKAEIALWRTLENGPSLETRHRIENILTEMKPPVLHLPLSGERLRGVRAIEVLERAGNDASRKLLQSWAEQSEDVPLAIEARMARERLGSVNRRAK